MKKIIMSTILTLPALSLSAQHFTYPETPRDNTVDHYFGVAVADPYRWLENDTSRQTAQWVEAQNAVTGRYLKGIKQRGKLLKRLTEVSNYGEVGTPF